MLIRFATLILFAISGGACSEQRTCQAPAFATYSMHFEDISQACAPALQGLLPDRFLITRGLEKWCTATGCTVYELTLVGCSVEIETGTDFDNGVFLHVSGTVQIEDADVLRGAAVLALLQREQVDPVLSDPPPSVLLCETTASVTLTRAEEPEQASEGTF